jgi:hypothetical protein
VREEVQKHFACPELTGAELEDQVLAGCARRCRNISPVRS